MLTTNNRLVMVSACELWRTTFLKLFPIQHVGRSSSALARDGEQTVRALTDHAGVPSRRFPSTWACSSSPAWSGPPRRTPDPLQRRAAGLWPPGRLDEHYGAFWRDRFDQLEDLLDRMDQ